MGPSEVPPSLGASVAVKRGPRWTADRRSTHRANRNALVPRQPPRRQEPMRSYSTAPLRELLDQYRAAGVSPRERGTYFDLEGE